MLSSFVRLAAFLLLLIMIATSRGDGQSIRVTLLGTGTPAPVMNRFGPSILVEAGSEKFLFDVGRGALQRLTQINVNYKDVKGVFFTHLHSDHIIGFPDLWLTGWINPRRDTPLLVWGPKGTEKMTAHLTQAFDYDIKIRLFDDRASPDGVVIEAKDIEQGVVYQKNGVRVTAFEVDHDPIKPAFGYRIDHGGRSVVLSGDTKPSSNLVKYAQGVDLLIHEVVVPDLLRKTGRKDEWIQAIINHHTTPEQAGEIFSKVKPKLAIYSHIVLPSGKENDVIPATRKTYAGKVELGEDLMVIDVGETVEVVRPKTEK